MGRLLEIMDLLDDANIPGKDAVEQVRNLLADCRSLESALRSAAKETDYGKLLASLDEDRSVTLHALADACLEAGRDDEAKGWGWLAMAGGWPVYTDGYWRWSSEGDGATESPRKGRGLPHVLPRRLHMAIWPDVLRAGKYKTAREAFLAVVNAIAQGVQP